MKEKKENKKKRGEWKGEVLEEWDNVERQRKAVIKWKIKERMKKRNELKEEQITSNGSMW